MRMLIGIDASRAFLRQRTGIEEYAYQTIRHLRDTIPETDTVVLYVRKKIEFRILNIESSGHPRTSESRIDSRFKIQDSRFGRLFGFRFRLPKMDFDIPGNWEVRGIWAPRFWTQIGLSLQMLFHPPDVLFVPAHTIPFIHPARNGIVFYKWDITWLRDIFRGSVRDRGSVAGRLARTIVTIHGLEYEFCRNAYSLRDALYMRFFIRYSCRVAETVIVVSENTKRDLVRLYGVSLEKIKVIYEGYTLLRHSERSEESRDKKASDKKDGIPRQTRDDIDMPYLLFIGRLEERKNVVRIIEAFGILKEKYSVPHTLVLVGKPGFAYERIRTKIQDSRFKDHIRELGYVSEAEKWQLLKKADVFLFPTLYEGFGIPVLEAQSVGVPVVTSDVSSLPEVGGEGAVYCDPMSAESIAEAIWKALSDKVFRGGIIEKGRANVSRFSWEQCANGIVQILEQ